MWLLYRRDSAIPSRWLFASLLRPLEYAVCYLLGFDCWFAWAVSLSPVFGGGCSDNKQQTGTLQKRLKSHGSEKNPTLFLPYAIILLKNFLIDVLLVGAMSELTAVLRIPMY